MSLNAQPNASAQTPLTPKRKRISFRKQAEVVDREVSSWTDVSSAPAESAVDLRDGKVLPFQHSSEAGTRRLTRPLSFVSPDMGSALFEVPQRVLLTMVFTDIVGSTETLERVGDRVWCSLLHQHHALVRENLAAHGGREVDAAGDGFFLVFDCPSRAVQFAIAMQPALRAIGIAIRTGIHTGECEVAGGRVEGLAVHMAARVAGAAGAGEILVSSTVRDVVAGSGHCFAETEPRVLKGLSQPRQLFALQIADESTAVVDTQAENASRGETVGQAGAERITGVVFG